ncbi:hypothetical protein [Rufibacter psychrotolerans]|uniref:hypothetical protein n=1 Tax=Rufibacter psychrotolerans TaxID=2812556 RepID=UPI0019672B31|nr:hypothetical protein [Rufibacter sp. SYSU D00308]
MKALTPIFRVAYTFAFFVFLFGCEEDASEPAPEVDLALARFADFQVAETPYVDIAITHPVVQNGQEIFPGRINLVVPRVSARLRLTPKATNANLEKFTVSPRLGEVQDFAGQPVVYTLTSELDPRKKVRYEVTITEAENPAYSQIATFTFEQAKNPGLPANVEAARIVHPSPEKGPGSIYVFVPVGTPFTNLTATIGHGGDQLFYSQDPSSPVVNSTSRYPEAGMSIDYAYPRQFFVFVKNGSETGTSTGYYRVIVDVRNPFKVEQPDITTAHVTKGAIRTLSGVAQITNQGNQALSLAGISHTNYVPANLTALRAFGGTQVGGLLPGESMAVNLTVDASTYPPGTYQTTASFSPKYKDDVNPEAGTLLEKANIRFTTTILD